MFINNYCRLAWIPSCDIVIMDDTVLKSSGLTISHKQVAYVLPCLTQEIYHLTHTFETNYKVAHSSYAILLKFMQWIRSWRLYQNVNLSDITQSKINQLVSYWTAWDVFFLSFPVSITSCLVSGANTDSGAIKNCNQQFLANKGSFKSIVNRTECSFSTIIVGWNGSAQFLANSGFFFRHKVSLQLT